MTDPLDALTKRDDSDVIPESVPYLRLGSGLDPYAWGWTEKEEPGLPPPVKVLKDLQVCARLGCRDCAAVLLRVWLTNTAAQMAIREGPQLDCE